MHLKNIFISIQICVACILNGQSIQQSLVSIDVYQASAKSVFNQIHQQTGAIFSYSEFNDDQKISLKVVDMPLKEVILLLEKAFHVSTLVKEKYVIIKPLLKEMQKEVEINGTIVQDISLEPIPEASVYIKQLKTLDNTDRLGRFMLRIPANGKQVKISVAKENYVDTSLILIASKNQALQIRLRSSSSNSINNREVIDFDSLETKNQVLVAAPNTQIPLRPIVKKSSYNDRFWSKMRLKNVNLNNISDTIFNRFSISLFPPISTNKLMSFHTRNNVALNIIGGTSKGVTGVELAGVFNYNDGPVIGSQLAGVMNVVSKNVTGVQLSGVFNTAQGEVKGLQSAGVINNNDSTMIGVQLSGVYQRANTLKGLQSTGVYNRANHMSGVQLSGLVNQVDSTAIGLQVAGLYNRSHIVKGVQISGLINQCDTLEGLQFGLINISKHRKAGLSLGLVNIAHNGFQKIELATNEWNTYQLGYRSGWHLAHLHYFVGVNVDTKNLHFVQAGGGLASSIPLSPKINLELDANVRNFYTLENFERGKFNMQNQCLIGLSWQPFKKIGIRAGITVNHLWYDPASELNQHLVSLIPHSFYSRSETNEHHKLWIGWQLGLTFL